MAKFRIDSGFKQTMRDAQESPSPTEGSETSAIGAFLLLLLAFGIAAISFVIANPDRAFTGRDSTPAGEMAP